MINAPLGRRIRLGVVGGGPGSVIGEIHRAAARLDGLYDVVASNLSSNPQRSRAFGVDLGIAPDRAYQSWQALIEGEGRRDDGIDALAVMTPNDSHYDICSAALDAGLHVICDKPLTTSLETSRDLAAKAEARGRVFCLTYCYTGYPMVRQARAMVRNGTLGEIRQVHLQYVQGHRALPSDPADWRLNPERVGPSMILMDIGTHALHLGAFVTHLDLDAVCADTGHVVPGRPVDDYAALLLRYENGARGSMWVTNAAAGAEHGLMFRVFGEKGGLEWHQEVPNQLTYRPIDGPAQTITRRKDAVVLPEALRVTRVAIGHPEGYHEAFANLYSDAAKAIAARATGGELDLLDRDFPTALDGVKGLAFVEASVDSAESGGWVEVPPAAL